MGPRSGKKAPGTPEESLALASVLDQVIHWEEQAATGAGCWTFRMLPSGAVILSTRKAPSLFGTSGLTMTLTP
jgi:hypothetical protein